MKKVLIVLALSFSLLASPVAAQTISTDNLLAQIQSLLQIVLDLQAQVQAMHTAQGGGAATSNDVSSGVPNFSAPVVFFQPVDYDICIAPPTRTLAFGVEGIDVLSLQEFLRDKAAYDGDLGGYFGQLTEAAVKRYQRSAGIVSGGDAATTGYGVVGPQTRQVIAQFCASAAVSTGSVQENAVSFPAAGYTSTVTDTQQSCAVAPALPDNFCANNTTATAVFGSDGCQTGWTCKAVTAEAPVACTADAFQCPNGEWVGRSGVNCQFDCTGKDTPPQNGDVVYGENPYIGDANFYRCTQDVFQCPSGGWVGRFGPECKFYCPSN